MRLVGTLLCLVAAKALAATAYVSDELVLNIYTEQDGQGQRLATLHSGATLDTLAVNGEFTQVRLNDGTLGWVKSSYLTTQEPATVRLKALEEELDRRRATTPELAEAAAHSEALELRQQLASKQAELDAAAARSSAPTTALAVSPSRVPEQTWVEVIALAATLACGFWLGYSTLARRIRQKFGGLKVY